MTNECRVHYLILRHLQCATLPCIPVLKGHWHVVFTHTLRHRGKTNIVLCVLLTRAHPGTPEHVLMPGLWHIALLRRERVQGKALALRASLPQPKHHGIVARQRGALARQTRVRQVRHRGINHD